MSSSSLTSWALLIWRTLQEMEVDPKPYFKRAELDPALLGDGNARYPVTRMYRLWHSLEELGDPYLGVRVGEHWTPTTFHALGFAWLASSSLKNAMNRLVRYCRLVNNALYTEFTPEGSHYFFTVSTTENSKLIHGLASDAAGAAILKMTRMLCGENFSPLKVFVRRAPTPGLRMLEDLYRTEVQFNCDRHGWLLDRLDVEKTIAGGNAELARMNDSIADKVLTRLHRDDIPGRVKQYIIETLPSGDLDEKDAADAVHMSTRNLQRRLREEGMTFNNMVNQIREDMALHYIDESHLSLHEIGYLLGFSEQASFTRAFKRWTGASPSQYRKQQADKVISAA